MPISALSGRKDHYFRPVCPSLCWNGKLADREKRGGAESFVPVAFPLDPLLLTAVLAKPCITCHGLPSE